MLVDEDLRDVLAAVVEDLPDPEHQVLPLRQRGRAPGRERLLRGRDSPADLLDRGEVDLARLHADRGVVDGPAPAGLAVLEAAANPVADGTQVAPLRALGSFGDLGHLRRGSVACRSWPISMRWPRPLERAARRGSRSRGAREARRRSVSQARATSSRVLPSTLRRSSTSAASARRSSQPSCSALVGDGKARTSTSRSASHLSDVGAPRQRRRVSAISSEHTSGLRDLYAVPEFLEAVVEDPQRRWSLDDLLGLVLGEPSGPPRADWSYSNTNYLLLSLVVERVGGSRPQDRLRADDRLARGYMPADNPFLPAETGSSTRPSSAASLAYPYGSVVDAGRGRKLLRGASRRDGSLAPSLRRELLDASRPTAWSATRTGSGSPGSRRSSGRWSPRAARPWGHLGLAAGYTTIAVESRGRVAAGRARGEPRPDRRGRLAPARRGGVGRLLRREPPVGSAHGPRRVERPREGTTTRGT